MFKNNYDFIMMINEDAFHFNATCVWNKQQLRKSRTFLSSIICIICMSSIHRCMAVEEITYPLPLLKNENLSYRQSLCNQQRQFENNETNLHDSLSGMNLSVFVLQDHHTFPIAAYQGIAIELLDEVAKRAGFSWRDSYSLGDLESTNTSNYDELLKRSTNQYDMSDSYWDERVTRISEGILFPHGWYDESLVMVEIKKPHKEQIKYLDFLSPFDYIVWLVIGATILFSAFTYYVLILLHAGAGAEDDTRRQPFLASLYIAAMTFTGNFDFQPVTNAARLFSFSLALSALILTASYTANLASFLVMKNTPVVTLITTNDIITQQIPTCVLSTSFSEEFLKRAYPNGKFIGKNDSISIIESLINNECDVAVMAKSMFDLMTREKLNNDCTLASTGVVLTRRPSGFAIRSDISKCSSHLSNVLELIFLEMEIDGFTKKAWNNYLGQMENQNCAIDSFSENNSNSGSAQLDMKGMAGIFIMHAVLSAVAILMALFSFCYKKERNKKRKNERKNDVPHTNERTSILQQFNESLCW